MMPNRIVTERIVLLAAASSRDFKTLRADCSLVRCDVVDYSPTAEPACDRTWLEIAAQTYHGRSVFFNERPFVPFLWRKTGIDLIPKGMEIQMFNGGTVTLFNHNVDREAKVELALTWRMRD